MAPSVSELKARDEEKRRRTIVITGASDGIGAAAARRFALDEVRLVLVGRSPTKTKAVAEQVGAEYHVCDFGRLDEVRQLAAVLLDTLEHIDVLANNAGGVFRGPTITVDGFEKTFQVNHLAPYLLTNLLIERLVASAASVINTSSIAARLYSRLDLDDLNGANGLRPLTAYGNSKLGNVLFAKELHRRFNSRGLSAVAIHPGGVATNFAADAAGATRWVYHTFLNRFLDSSDKGGARLAHFIAGRPGEAWVSGEYYGPDLTIKRTHKLAYDPQVARRHWELSAEMLGVTWAGGGGNDS